MLCQDTMCFCSTHSPYQVQVSHMEICHKEKISKLEEETHDLLEKMAGLVRRNKTLSSEVELR